MKKYILGIESSCDDTSAAVLENNRLLANVIANQEVHKKYGVAYSDGYANINNHHHKVLKSLRQRLRETLIILSTQ